MSKAARRRIREAVVQFLYAAGPEEGLEDVPDHDLIFLISEPPREKALQARVKALLHLQQGRSKAAAELPNLLRRVSRIAAVVDDPELLPAVRELAAAEESIAEGLEHLRYELNGNKSARRFRSLLEDVRQANRRSRAASQKIAQSAPTFPTLQEIQAETLEIWASLSSWCDRLDAALAIDLGPQPELRAARQAADKATHISESLRDYLVAVRSHLPVIDRHLAEVIDNYKPERIDRVDRAILRLGAYELLYDPEIPPAVAINEAIELARTFGTSDSARFVNGVLDRLAREKDGVRGRDTS